MQIDLDTGIAWWVEANSNARSQESTHEHTLGNSLEEPSCVVPFSADGLEPSVIDPYEEFVI
jgi:hypothetical protein